MIDDIYKVGDYYPTIGIECHVQLKTATKLFAAVGNDARSAAPNTLISHICLGMPGALPVLNEKAVELGIRAAFALNIDPQPFSKFDRKHYFYPDLPMGYQITQFEQPIILGGHVDITIDGVQKRINITRAHLEADAGKSTHPTGANYSLIDLNRAGTPLLEIVSEPEIHSATEAKAYVHELHLLMKYADVSDANLFYGNMRFDVNVSVSKDPKVLGTRSETKNLNSFRSVYDAVNYEIKRQIEVLNAGEKVVQETRGWLDDQGKTFAQRTKEDAHDYRYFPDPDIPPVLLDEKVVDTIKQTMPVMPKDYRIKFAEIGLTSEQIETLLDEPEAVKLLSEVVNSPESAKTIGNWLTSAVPRLVSDNQISWASVYNSKDQLVTLAINVKNGMLSSTAAKSILKDIIESDLDPIVIAQEKNLIQLSDTVELEKIVREVLAANAQAAEDVKNGEMKAIGFLTGQVMKASAGKANPSIVQQLICQILGI